LHAFAVYFTNTLRLAEETQIDQEKDGKTNAYEDCRSLQRLNMIAAINVPCKGFVYRRLFTNTDAYLKIPTPIYKYRRLSTNTQINLPFTDLMTHSDGLTLLTHCNSFYGKSCYVFWMTNFFYLFSAVEMLVVKLRVFRKLFQNKSTHGKKITLNSGKLP
jgi:hypothetical protein